MNRYATMMTAWELPVPPLMRRIELPLAAWRTELRERLLPFMLDTASLRLVGYKCFINVETTSPMALYAPHAERAKVRPMTEWKRGWWALAHDSRRAMQDDMLRLLHVAVQVVWTLRVYWQDGDGYLVGDATPHTPLRPTVRVLLRASDGSDRAASMGWLENRDVVDNAVRRLLDNGGDPERFWLKQEKENE